jgi:hypothetical protein
MTDHLRPTSSVELGSGDNDALSVAIVMPGCWSPAGKAYRRAAMGRMARQSGSIPQQLMLGPFASGDGVGEIGKMA